MGKRNGKQRPSRKRSGGTSGSGGMPEQYLTPGAPERERLLDAQEALREAGEVSTAPDEPEKELDADERPVEAAYSLSQGSRNYRNFMKKYSQVDEARAIVEEGIGRSVSGSDMDDELYDPQVDAADFKRAVVADHAVEFESLRETPVIDTNGDGRVDGEDEPIMTPGMRRMARYM